MFKAKYEQFTYNVAFISQNANRWVLLLSSMDNKETGIEILSK